MQTTLGGSYDPTLTPTLIPTLTPNPHPHPNPHPYPCTLTCTLTLTRTLTPTLTRFRRLIGVASTMHGMGVTRRTVSLSSSPNSHPNPNPEPNQVTPHGFVKFMGAGMGRSMLARYERNGGTRRSGLGRDPGRAEPLP